MILELIFAALAAGFSIYVGWSIYDVLGKYERPKVEDGYNDDDEAIEKIKMVVREAQHSVEIFDDGDKIEGGGKSVYDDQGFLDLVAQKLDNGVSFQCLFNSDNKEMGFRERFDDDPKVDILVRRNDGNQRHTVHYKNADKGRMIYLTRHESGSKNRQFKMIDARNNSEDYRKSLHQNLGQHRQALSDFEKVG